MTFSQKYQKQVQPTDFLIQVGKTVTKLELAQARTDLQAQIRHQLLTTIANHIVDREVERVEGENAVTFKLDLFVIPKDEFFGLVQDMANAIVTEINEEKHV